MAISDVTTNIEEHKLNVDWTDLPKDILIRVMEKLRWIERRPSGSVCKTWHQCFLESQNAKEFLPWAICYVRDPIGDGVICKLGDPSARTTYNVKETTKNIDLCGANPRATRLGWLLFSKMLNDHSNDFGFKNHIFFLYSPFTNEIIRFPELETHNCVRATFSNTPDSPNCIVLTFFIKNERFYINTCRPGDTSWKMYEYGDECRYYYILEVAYVCGFVYCAFVGGKRRSLEDKRMLGSFNVKQQEWKVLSELDPMSSWSYQNLIVAFNGDLLIHCTSLVMDVRKFWRFDLSENKWVSVEDEIMKRQAIFIGSTSFSVPAVENARESAGKIYYLPERCTSELCYPYNFDDFEPVPEDNKWLIEDNRLMEIRGYRLRTTWIQPPFQKNLVSL